MLESKGAVWVDAGAAQALLDHGKSLLISGVTKAEGDFSYQDIVSVYHQETGQLLGKGQGSSRPVSCARYAPI